MGDGTTAAEMEYDIQAGDGVQVLQVSGEVDIAAVGSLKVAVEGLLLAGAFDLVYDLGQVEAIDSTGLGFLVWSRKRLREHGGRLRLVVSGPQVHRVLRLTGLARLFEVYASMEEAMAQAAPEEQADRFRPEGREIS